MSKFVNIDHKVPVLKLDVNGDFIQNTGVRQEIMDKICQKLQL